MHLTVSNIAHFLVGRGLLSTDSIVAGDVTIVDASRRNRNFKVMLSGGRGFFVKQMREMQHDSMLTLRREAACYERARSDHALSRLMPRLIVYDPGRHVLIVELLVQAESLADYHAREKSIPADIGRMLGTGLGLYHSRAADIVGDQAMQSMLSRQVPAVLRWQSGGHNAIGQFGRIGRALSTLVQMHSEFESLLDKLGAEWRFDSLIHGDMKWDNVLLFPRSDGKLDFRIVDWEMVDIGDAAWDVGAVLQSFLTVWILSMPLGSGLPPEHYVSMATHPIESMRSAIRAFWEAYATTRNFSATERVSALERATRFAAARLVWATVEQRLYSAQLDSAMLALLQVSMNILKSPARAVTELLFV
jgi:hypothetical protein